MKLSQWWWNIVGVVSIGASLALLIWIVNGMVAEVSEERKDAKIDFPVAAGTVIWETKVDSVFFSLVALDDVPQPSFYAEVPVKVAIRTKDGTKRREDGDWIICTDEQGRIVKVRWPCLPNRVLWRGPSGRQRVLFPKVEAVDFG